jgi:hypothetical protein
MLPGLTCWYFQNPVEYINAFVHFQPGFQHVLQTVFNGRLCRNVGGKGRYKYASELSCSSVGFFPGTCDIGGCAARSNGKYSVPKKSVLMIFFIFLVFSGRIKIDY